MEPLGLITPLFLLLVVGGTLFGIIFGAILGMTATMAAAICLPQTYSPGLENGLALLLGLYVGGISGGLVPAILLGIPGTPSSIATCFEGHPMVQRGEGEKALRIDIVSSLAALYFFAPPLADFAIKLSYVEKFLVILFALTVMAALSTNMLLGIFSGFLGIFFSLIGVYDVTDGGNGHFRLIPPGLDCWLEGGASPCCPC